MKKTMINETYVEGYLYQHALQLKTTGERSKTPGVQFINGTVDIATDDAMTNIVTVHYTYVTAKTKSGSDNATFTTLQNIINGTHGNVMEHGVDKAAKVRVNSVIGLNEFFSNRSGTDELVSVKRNEGGFIHLNQNLKPDEKQRSTFNCDMIITNAVRSEADEERNRPEQMKLKGYVFDYRNALLPVEFTVLNNGAMDYFENLDTSPKNPCFTRVQGRQVSSVTIVRKVEESAFGEAIVTETPYTNRDFVVTWAMSEPYAWDDESTITKAEYEQALADREMAVATIKQRQDEYRASQATTTTTAPTTSNSGFNF